MNSYTNKRKKKQTKIETWLRDHISDIDHGILYKSRRGKPHPIHCNKNQRVLEVINQVPDRSWRNLEYLSNAKLERHFANNETFYFAGNQRSRAKALILIDIDCHHCGSLNGAVAFAEWLRKNHYPTLYYEVSTNGNGVHAYFVLDKLGMGASYVNDLLLQRMQPWLDNLAREQGFDLELVEIKGTLPVLSWGERRGELTNYKSGVLGKIPRGAKVRAAELMATTQLTTYDLRKIRSVQHKPIEIPETTKTTTKITITPTAVTKQGSVSGKVIGDDELTNLDRYRELARQLMTSHKIDVGGKNRAVATDEDVAIFLLLGRFFTLNMNEDGSLPWKRWKNMWNSLFRAEDVNRTFDPHRFAAVRNFFDSLSLIDWSSNRFVIGTKDVDGVRRGGRACKWKFSERLMELLLTAIESNDFEKETVSRIEEEEGKTSLAVTLVFEGNCPELIEKREEEAPLAVTTIQNIIKSLVQKPWELITRPQLDDQHYLWRLDPDDLTAYITPFDLLLAA